MGFRTVYGRNWSENGWRMCDWNECDTGVVPGTNGLKLPIRRGDANTILKGWVAWYNANVESLANSRGYADEGSFTWTNSVASSNHLSASGAIWWGQDWYSPKDAMHFQLNYPEGDRRNTALAADLRAGYLNIWNGGPIGMDTGGRTPPAAALSYGANGPAVSRLQAGLNAVFPSYPGLPLAVDGDFGPRTRLAVQEFQRRVGITPDGVVGPQTRTWLAKFGIKP